MTAAVVDVSGWLDFAPVCTKAMRTLGKERNEDANLRRRWARTECGDPECSLAGRRGRLVGFVKLGLYADWTAIDLGGDRQVGYPNGFLVHVTDTARMHVREAFVPNDAKGLIVQEVEDAD
jgi:hypothetical protein